MTHPSMHHSIQQWTAQGVLAPWGQACSRQRLLHIGSTKHSHLLTSSYDCQQAARRESDERAILCCTIRNAIAPPNRTANSRSTTHRFQESTTHSNIEPRQHQVQRAVDIEALPHFTRFLKYAGPAEPDGSPKRHEPSIDATGLRLSANILGLHP